MEKKIEVSVVVPCFNEKGFIRSCVESVIVSGKNSSRGFEIIVVDGDSDDGTIEILRQLQSENTELNVLKNPKRITPISLNTGIKSAKGEVVIILGAHSTVEPKFIEANLNSLLQRPEAACVGGVIRNTYDGDSGELYEVALSSSFGVGNARFRTGGEAGFVDTVAFGAYRKHVFEQIGYFNEDLARNQDDEFNFRLLKNGMKIYFDPAIKSNYFVRTEVKKLGKQYYQYGYWKVYVNRLHGQVTTLRQLAPFFLVLSIVAYPVFVSLSILLETKWLAWLSVLIALEMLVYFVLLMMVSRAHTDSFRDSMKLRKLFWTLHWNYGLGYLYGILDFLVLRKRPSSANTSTTR